MKILLISPWDKKHRRFRSRLKSLFVYPPLAIPVLSALVPPEVNAEIIVFDEFSDKKLPESSFDVVGITVIAQEAIRAYELADYYRSKGAFVVLGGYHATFMPEEALSHANAIVTGPGMQSWPKLLRDLHEGRKTEQIYTDENETFDLDFIPDRSHTQKRPYCPVEAMISAQGCPNKCFFCSISCMSEYHHRRIDAVIRDIKSLKRRTVIFYDPNFFVDREYALELMKEMEPFKLRWAATATVGFGYDDELLTAARRSGCVGVLIGFESLNPAALEYSKKKYRDIEVYKQAIENIHRYNITINGTFVLGFDTDTEDDLYNLPKGIRELGVDLAMYYVLTPMPGTDLFNEMKSQNRVLTEDWSLYTQANAVYQPLHMTPKRLEELYNRAWRETYAFREIFRRVLRTRNTSLYHKLAVICINIGFKFMGRDKPAKTKD